MLFLNSLTGRHVAASSIAQIGRPYKRHPNDLMEVCDIYLADGGETKATKYAVCQLLDTPAHMISATPGTYLLQPHDDYSDAFREPVVGWSISLRGDFQPVTSDGPFNFNVSECPGYVLHPNGTVVDIFTGAAWLTEREFLAAMKAQDSAHASGAEPVREPAEGL